jgi:regulatory protein
MGVLKSKITAIKAGRNPKVRRSGIYLDGKFAFSLDNEVVARELLKVGGELSAKEADLLMRSDLSQRCLNAALRLLSYRPRSEAETRERLQRRGYNADEIERAVARLKRLDLLNDTAFAEFWKENRTSFRPGSQRMLKLELRRKGVEREVADKAVEDVDDAENAYRAALDKARTIPVSDYQVFRRRLGGYLQRRGFSYGVINNIVKRTWQEKVGEAAKPSDLAGETGVTD